MKKLLIGGILVVGLLSGCDALEIKKVDNVKVVNVDNYKGYTTVLLSSKIKNFELGYGDKNIGDLEKGKCYRVYYRNDTLKGAEEVECN